MRWGARGGSSADTAQSAGGGEVEEQSPHDAEDRDGVFAAMERRHQAMTQRLRALAAMEGAALAEADDELALEAAESSDTSSSSAEDFPGVD